MPITGLRPRWCIHYSERGTYSFLWIYAYEVKRLNEMQIMADEVLMEFRNGRYITDVERDNE